MHKVHCASFDCGEPSIYHVLITVSLLTLQAIVVLGKFVFMIQRNLSSTFELLSGILDPDVDSSQRAVFAPAYPW